MRATLVIGRVVLLSILMLSNVHGDVPNCSRVYWWTQLQLGPHDCTITFTISDSHSHLLTFYKNLRLMIIGLDTPLLAGFATSILTTIFSRNRL